MQTSATGFWRFVPWISRLVMFPPVIIFTLIMLRYFTDPAHAISGTILTAPETFTDTRVIGAWMLTLLILLITFLLSPERLWLGHLQLVVFMSTTLVARVFGFLHDGTTLATGDQRIITILEIVLLILNSMGLMLQTAWRKNNAFSGSNG